MATPQRALLAGHFSTIGDIESLEAVQSWLGKLDMAYDVAPFSESVRACIPGSVPLASVTPESYSAVILICGPIWPEQLRELGFDFNRYSHCLRVGINLTLVESVSVWDPFDLLLERDSDRLTRPDLSFAIDTPTVPVVGRCLVKRQRSYEGREQHHKAAELIDKVMMQRGWAVLDLDTRWYREKNPLANASQFISALQRVDLLLTNRLHGMVYAIKAGVPVVALDAIEGTAKVSAQADILGWPHCIAIEDATEERLHRAIDACMTDDAALLARRISADARTRLEQIEQEFLSALGKIR